MPANDPSISAPHDAEIFRPTGEFKGYYIGHRGSVLSGRSVNGRSSMFERSQRLRRRKTSIGHWGYPTIAFQAGSGKQTKTRKIHRLMLQAFVGPCPPGMEACHNDGDPANFSLDNLRWDTPKNNAADRVLHGTAVFGSRQGGAVLDEEKVTDILWERSQGKKLYEIAAQFNTSLVNVYQICSGGSWKHVFGPRVVPKRRPRIGPEIRDEARRLRKEGCRICDVAIRLGISEASVSLICRRKLKIDGRHLEH